MNSRKCNKCGFTYDCQAYGHRCPQCGWREMDFSSRQYEEDLSESQWGKLYGPPPVSNHQENDRQQYLSDPHMTLYGPPTVDYFSHQRPWYKRTIIIFVIGVLSGWIIVWLLGDCQSTVYGPPPVDSTQTIVPVDNE